MVRARYKRVDMVLVVSVVMYGTFFIAIFARSGSRWHHCDRSDVVELRTKDFRFFPFPVIVPLVDFGPVKVQSLREGPRLLDRPVVVQLELGFEQAMLLCTEPLPTNHKTMIGLIANFVTLIAFFRLCWNLFLCDWCLANRRILRLSVAGALESDNYWPYFARSSSLVL